MINFAYLLVQGCNNCEYDGIPQLRESIISLKNFHKDCKIYKNSRRLWVIYT